MTAKSRIAQITENSLSIPKIELQSALTVSKIKIKIIEKLKETVTSMFLWSDLGTVLNYLHNDYSNSECLLLTVSMKFFIVPI